MKNRRVKRPKNLRLFAIAILAVAILYIAQFDIHWDFTEPTVQIDTELAIPDYSGQAYVIINDNMPYFDDADKNTNTFESYSDLDSLGR